jgi:hypothetical protein
MTPSMINKVTENEKLCAICFLQQRKAFKNLPFLDFWNVLYEKQTIFLQLKSF